MRKVRIGDILELQRRPVDVDLATSYRPIGVRGFGRGLFSYDTVPGAQLGKMRFFDLEADRLVVSNIKGWEGAVAVTSNDEAGRVASNRFLTYAASSDAVDLRYVANWLLADPGLAALGRASPGSADRNRTLSIRSFEAVEVPLPPIEEQRRIAAHLDRIARNAGRISARASALDTTLSADALPRVVSARIQADDLPRVAVAHLVDSINDTIHPGDDVRGAAEFVGLEHVESHTGRSLGSRPVGDETGRKFRFEDGDVTFGYLRPYLNKVWAADRVGLCSVEQFVLRPRGSVRPEDLAHVLRSSIVLDAAVAATNRLQLPRLRLATLMGLEVPDIRQGNRRLFRDLDSLRDRFVELAALRAGRRLGIASLLPAARNEVFNLLR